MKLVVLNTAKDDALFSSAAQGFPRRQWGDNQEVNRAVASPGECLCWCQTQGQMGPDRLRKENVLMEDKGSGRNWA